MVGTARGPLRLSWCLTNVITVKFALGLQTKLIIVSPPLMIGVALSPGETEALAVEGEELWEQTPLKE